MILWLDAQLPPSLAHWLKRTFNIDALAARELGLRDAKDKDIFAAARAAGVVLLSKDADFVELVQRLGPPPHLMWLTCGNVTNERLEQVMTKAFPPARDLIMAGQPIVEIGDS